ncbi:hypothetical protein G7Y89_g2885 [Cudoniella acicularis]|uniref:BTB domain-containing protein n=1 Tax=Cudoniella acicularis TaxID=354080 RepID=A0A8H4RTA0_9HELO|nr:hypothetical protein G7Y89_g2885 [Cudoniella acicularis]
MAAPLGDRLGTDIITLVVGPKRKEFAVHKSILCDASDLFAKDLVKKEDVPGIKSHLHYPTDDPTVISLFVDYLYRSTVPERSASGDLFTLFNLYLFAERLCLRDLANKTADRIQDLLQQLPTDQPGAEEFAKDPQPSQGSTQPHFLPTILREAAKTRSRGGAEYNIASRSTSRLLKIRICKTGLWHSTFKMANHAPPTLLGDNIGTQMVTIIVGRSRTKFVVHKDLICHTAVFFSKAFTSAFVERDGVMGLPEESPEAFSLFVDWLYKGVIPCVTAQAHLENLVKLYVFAEKLCLEVLANKTMDQIAMLCHFFKAAEISTPMVEYIYKNTFTDSPIRLYSLRDWVYHLDIEGKTGVPRDKDIKGLRQLFDKAEDFFLDYFRHSRKCKLGGMLSVRV